jgi:hypothetical protein
MISAPPLTQDACHELFFVKEQLIKYNLSLPGQRAKPVRRTNSMRDGLMHAPLECGFTQGKFATLMAIKYSGVVPCSTKKSLMI